MENYSNPSTLQQESNQLSDDLQQLQQHTDASTGQRFINWLVDNLLMQYGLSYITGTFVGFLLGSLFPEFMRRLIESDDQSDLLILGYIIAMFNYIFYYTICEKAFKGYTLGK